MASRADTTVARKAGSRKTCKLTAVLPTTTGGTLTTTGQVLQGIRSVVRAGAGLYTFTLDDVWVGLDNVTVSVQIPNGVPSGGTKACGDAAVVSGTFSLSTKTIQVQLLTAAGAAGDVDDAGTIRVSFDMDAGKF